MGVKRRVSGRIRLYLKNMGAFGCVPPVVMDLVVPVALVSGYLHYGRNSAELDALAMQLVQTLLPLFSVWWSLFLLRDYVEADGRELLHIAVRKRALREAALPFLIAMANVLIVLGLGGLLVPVLFTEILRILPACVFLFGLSYCLVYLLRSITMALFGVILYTLMNWFILVETPFFPLYMSTYPIDGSQLLTLSLPLTAAGILLTMAGVWCNKKFFDYG